MNENDKKYVTPVGIGVVLETLREDPTLVAKRFTSKGFYVKFDESLQKYVKISPLMENYFATDKDIFIPSVQDMTDTDWVVAKWEDVKDTQGYHQDTMKHVEKVRKNLKFFIDNLDERGKVHDRSKFTPEEFDVMKETFPDLKSTTYGTPEYKQLLERIQPALEYHYARNDHHPEHHNDGINDMNLFQVIEMLCDWKAASERHADGDPFDSINKNKERFGLSDQLYSILLNTLKYWKQEEQKVSFTEDTAARAFAKDVQHRMKAMKA